MKIAIYCVSKNGYSIALDIREKVYENSDIYISERVFKTFILEKQNVKKIFKIDGKLSDLVGNTFIRYDLHIFIMATGIVVRVIDGKSTTKDKDPGVITVDEQANFVIPILSGHLGGANESCRKIASGIKAIPVITTATDVSGKIAVDTMSQKLMSKLENLEDAKRVTSLIVNGENVSLYLPKNIVNTTQNSSGAIIISNRKKIEISKIIPQNIVLGIGCRRGIKKEHIIEKLTWALNCQNLEINSIKKVASAWVKSDEIGLIEAMKELNIPIEFFEKEEILEVEDLIENKSEYVKKSIGVYGVSEPCEYLASTKKGEFLAKKIVLDGITLSIFEEDM